MKRLFLAVLFTATVFISFGQTKQQEDSIMNLMNNELCKELAKMPASEFTAENFQVKLGMQMMGVFQNYDTDLKMIYGEDYSLNQTTVMEIGKKIGMKLATSCKAFQELIMNNPDLAMMAMEKTSKQKTVQVPVEKSAGTVKPPTWGFTAKVISFTPGDVSFYTVKDGTQIRRVYWLGKFDGDDELIANPKKIIGKKAFFRLTENRVYSATEKLYKKISVIVAFESEPTEEIREDQVISDVPVKN